MSTVRGDGGEGSTLNTREFRVVETWEEGRPARSFVITTEDFQLLAEEGNAIQLSRWDLSTRAEMNRLWKQYASFRQAAADMAFESEIAEEADVLSAYAAFRINVLGNKAQTLQSDVCLIIDVLRVKGIPFSEYAAKLLVRGLGKKRVPAIRANPLRLRQVETILQDTSLPLTVRGAAALIWLSGQRPFHLQEFRIELMSFVGQELWIWITDSKFFEDIDRSTLRCKRLVLGSFEPVIRDLYRYQLLRGERTLIQRADLSILERYLRRLKVRIHHPLLRAGYTLYSLRRGSIQHLAASGVLPDQISSLTDHRSLRALAGYIGAYLDPKSIESARVSQALTVPVYVPEEFPTMTVNP